MITIGQIVRPQGTRGEVKILPMTDVPERFYHLKKATLADRADNRMEVEVERATYIQQSVILKLKGVDTVHDADRLRNMFLLVQSNEVYPLPEGQYSLFEILRLEVLTELAERIGRVENVIQLKSNDVYVVRSVKGEVLIPAIKEIVKAIDTEGGRIIIDPMEGLPD